MRAERQEGKFRLIWDTRGDSCHTESSDAVTTYFDPVRVEDFDTENERSQFINENNLTVITTD